MGHTKFEYKSLRDRQRWFCYLDLLGFTDLVNSTQLADVMPIYGDVLEKLQGSISGVSVIKPGMVLYSWFSDTFIIYSRGKSAKDFTLIERVSRLFFQKLIVNHIPVRGALTFGGLYSQLAQNIFVGPALIDSYQHADNQNWLGFILTPKAVTRMAEVGLAIENRPFYRQIDNTYLKHPCNAPIYAFDFNNGTVNGRNTYLEAMLAMQQKAGPNYAAKYTRTIAFINEHTKGTVRDRR